ncbi:MAG: class I SAM-dependent methyltransferase [Candidatus Dormibacteraeota bacterium]|nr:class I SAM-dependent methyltransferase [Candidatus Dormibacteraeota bacterium]
MRSRNPAIGPDVVGDWARRLPAGGSVLDLGCGHGVISQALVDLGLTVYGVDASPTLLDAFRRRFPGAGAECAAAEDSRYFDRTFDGVIAWGLIFLLPEPAQRTVITRAAGALELGGGFLFTAPAQALVWTDVLTGRESRSLGAAEYRSLLRQGGCEVRDGRTDRGGNHYFCATRKTLAR